MIWAAIAASRVGSSRSRSSSPPLIPAAAAASWSSRFAASTTSVVSVSSRAIARRAWSIAGSGALAISAAAACAARTAAATESTALTAVAFAATCAPLCWLPDIDGPVFHGPVSSPPAPTVLWDHAPVKAILRSVLPAVVILAVVVGSGATGDPANR